MINSFRIRALISILALMGTLILSILIVSSTALGETVLLEDTFEGENGGNSQLNYAGFANWDVVVGSVDVIKSGNFAIGCAGSNMCVDLDGTTFAAGTIQSKALFNLEPAVYELSFDLSGNQRAGKPGGNSSDTVHVSLGDVYKETFTKAPNNPFETITRTISIETATSARLTFQHTGGDNIGLILDNVKLTLLTIEPPPLAAILPNFAVVPDEQGFHFMWEQVAELDSGGEMNLWCAEMNKDNHTFKNLTKINQQITAAIGEAFYPSSEVKGVKYCTLEEINAAGKSTIHCDAAVVIGDDTAINIADLEAAKALCHKLTQ